MELEAIEQVERAKLLVLQGEEEIRLQQNVIAELKSGDYDSSDAEALLKVLLVTQECRVDNLTMLEDFMAHQMPEPAI